MDTDFTVDDIFKMFMYTEKDIRWKLTRMFGKNMQLAKMQIAVFRLGQWNGRHWIYHML